jgi:hypothetical protein
METAARLTSSAEARGVIVPAGMREATVVLPLEPWIAATIAGGRATIVAERVVEIAAGIAGPRHRREPRIVAAERLAGIAAAIVAVRHRPEPWIAVAEGAVGTKWATAVSRSPAPAAALSVGAAAARRVPAARADLRVWVDRGAVGAVQAGDGASQPEWTRST